MGDLFWAMSMFADQCLSWYEACFFPAFLGVETVSRTFGFILIRDERKSQVWSSLSTLSITRYLHSRNSESPAGNVDSSQNAFHAFGFSLNHRPLPAAPVRLKPTSSSTGAERQTQETSCRVFLPVCGQSPWPRHSTLWLQTLWLCRPGKHSTEFCFNSHKNNTQQMFTSPRTVRVSHESGQKQG